MFGRRRSGSSRGKRARPAHALDPELADDAQSHDVGLEAPPQQGGGPWDVGDRYPELPRVDLGSLLVPVAPEFQVHITFAENQGAWVTVHHSGGELQLQAFAAPKHEGIWRDIWPEIMAEVNGAGGTCEEREGPFGPEVLARVPAQPGVPASGFVPIRFVGVDGPRWFLRGLFQGQATVDPAAAAPLEALIREVVVVRGDHPVPPRDLLELRLPPDAAQALAEQQAQAAQQQTSNQGYPVNPFERGPEITETR
ncbi:MAG TPA: DUF3710 domain-containing protein [Trebonia sp.]